MNQNYVHVAGSCKTITLIQAKASCRPSDFSVPDPNISGDCLNDAITWISDMACSTSWGSGKVLSNLPNPQSGLNDT